MWTSNDFSWQVIWKMIDCTNPIWQFLYQLEFVFSREIEKCSLVNAAGAKMHHFRGQLLSLHLCGGTQWIIESCGFDKTTHLVSSLKNVALSPAGSGGQHLQMPRFLWARAEALVLAPCQTLCRTEQIRMKYWLHLWISGAERPHVGTPACIFSWWKPLDGSFLLAASLKSESQKCNTSRWQKEISRCIEVKKWFPPPPWFQLEIEMYEFCCSRSRLLTSQSLRIFR